MDPQIKSRMKTDIKIFPCTGTTDGDKIFGNPIDIKAYIVPKYNVELTIKGKKYITKCAVYIDGIHADILDPECEIQIPFVGRVPVKLIVPYPGITVLWEIIELLI